MTRCLCYSTFLSFLLLAGLSAFSQNVGIGTANPHPLALVDMTASGKGMLIPRMARSVRNGILNPPEALMLWDSTLKSFFYWADASGWTRILGEPDQFWTQDAGNIYRGSGSVGIGNVPVTDPSAVVHIGATNKGVLFPRMSESDRNLIASPANGLLLYNTTRNELNIYGGTNWLGVQYALPKGTLLLSDSSHHTGLQQIGFEKTSYMDQPVVSQASATTPPKNWYLVNQADILNESAPFYAGDGSLTPPVQHNGHYVVLSQDSVWRYNPATDSWSRALLVNGPISIGDGARVVVCGDQLVCWNGFLEQGHMVNLLTNTATAMSSVNSPSQRGGYSMVWSGSQLLIWGGVNYSNTYFNNGAAFNPATNTWSSIAAPGIALLFFGRTGHTAVWSGTEMIIWGGQIRINRTVPCISFNPFTLSSDTVYTNYDSTMYLSNGIRYNPSTGVYTLLPASPLSARSGHSAISASGDMIIWGGTNVLQVPICGNGVNTQSGFVSTGGPFNTGARYNFLTNTWLSLPVPSFPGKAGHLAVWTGSRMLIVGGANNRKKVYSYNRSANQWVSNEYPDCPVDINNTSIDLVGAVWMTDKLLVANLSNNLSAARPYQPYAISDVAQTLQQLVNETKRFYIYRKN